MYGFKAIAFYPVHTNPFMFVYGFSFGNFFIFKARARVTMTMRTWPQEGESIRIHLFTRLYENGVSVGIRFGSRFQISPFRIFA